MALLSHLSAALPRGLVWRWAAWLATFVGLATGVFGQVVSKEYQVKAVFLYNFVQFVEWPPAAFPTPETSLVIGVLGEDPFGSFLDETVRGEKVVGRTLVVRRYRRAEDVDACHLVFIGRLPADELAEALGAFRTRHILTVGESDSFASHGGVIRFLTENNRIRLRINLDAAKRAGLTISAKLLRPAEIVGDSKQ